MALQHLRSSTADKRPTPAVMSDGQLAMNTNLVSPGLFLKDSNGDLVKVGPVHVGTTAPNATPGAGGQAGNSKGEQWLDTSSSRYVFKIWDGTAWRTEDGEFVNISGDTMTGALGIIAGSAATPGVFFSGDPNTGIYSPGADQVAVATNGVGRLVINATGNAILGATDAKAQLHVYGTGQGTANLTDAGARGALLRLSDTESTAGAGGGIIFSNIQGDTANSVGFAAIKGLLTNGTSNTEGNLAFAMRATAASTSLQERLRITSAGLVGIGTSTPQGLLHVAGGYLGVGYNSSGTYPAYNTYFGAFGSNFSNGGSEFDIWNTVGAGFAFRSQSGASTQSCLLYIDGTGKVGIGTTSPAVPLDIVGQVRTTDSTVDLRLLPLAASSVGIVGTISNHALSFFTNNTERARIDSSGRLLVGASASRSASGLAAILQVETTGYGIMSLVQNSADAGGAVVTLGKTRSATVGGSTVVQNNDNIATLYFNGADGSGLSSIGAAISADVDGTPGANDMPGRLVFSTTADGAAFPTERLRIDSSGFVSLGGDTNTGLSNPSADNLAITTNGSERVRIDSSGRLLVGTSSARSNFYNGTDTGIFQVEGANDITKRFSSIIYGRDNVDGPLLLLGKHRGTSVGSSTLVASGDEIGRITFQGTDGSEFVAGAEIQASVDGTPGTNDMPGRLVFSTTADGASSPTERMRITSTGVVTANTSTAAEGGTVFVAQASGRNVSIACDSVDGGEWNTGAATAMRMGRNSVTLRSINAGGTINASGADYAEYMIKAGDFIIAKGDVCGVTADGQLANEFADAVSFVVKSTNPSYVGGDTWGSEDAVGPKPDAGDTEVLAQWKADLEAARQQVDRIAFAGQVPVNVLGATSGQYIVPVEAADGGIEGVAKNKSDMTAAEYMDAVGKVIAIEDDGRARIIVKVA